MNHTTTRRSFLNSMLVTTAALTRGKAMCAAKNKREVMLGLLEKNARQEYVRKGMEVITESLMLFVKECIRLGADGFYASTQGGEAGRLKEPRLFKDYIKPFDLVLMNEMNRSCEFNILHVCDYNGPYSDLTPFLDYPGHVVNCNPQLLSGKLGWKEIAKMFKRPCMGGLDRHGIIASGSGDQINKAVEQVLNEAPAPFVLGADCTLPNDIKWENIKTAISAAHRHHPSI